MLLFTYILSHFETVKTFTNPNDLLGKLSIKNNDKLIQFV